MIEGYGRVVKCPKCGCKLEVVSNGLFGEAFYCPNEKRAFLIQLIDVTKKAGKGFMEQCEKESEVETLRNKIVVDNVFKIKKLLTEVK